MTTRTANLLDKVLGAAASPDGPLDDERARTLWTCGIVVLADVLLRTDHFTRERLIRGVDHELREACDGITAIMTHGPSAAPKGH